MNKAVWISEAAKLANEIIEDISRAQNTHERDAKALKLAKTLLDMLDFARAAVKDQKKAAAFLFFIISYMCFDFIYWKPHLLVQACINKDEAFSIATMFNRDILKVGVIVTADGKPYGPICVFGPSDDDSDIKKLSDKYRLALNSSLSKPQEQSIV